ncbi:hypothetical protein BDD12DRAFT_887818 [Trichophaea hybrida]|nr:hypothetical protein BDD12DRAFT_887818 [Trichophaea hybrida]
MRVEHELHQQAFLANGGSRNGSSSNGSLCNGCTSNGHSSNSSKRPKQGHLHDLESSAWRDDIHSCWICLVVFESGSQLHKHLRQSMHFSPLASLASSRQSSPVPMTAALPPPATSQQISTPPSLSNSRLTFTSMYESAPPPTPSALPQSVLQLAASPMLGTFGSITSQSPGQAPSRSTPSAKGIYVSDNKRTQTMDLETQFQATFTQIQELRWTSLSGDRPPVLCPPDDLLEPWDVILISSFD